MRITSALRSMPAAAIFCVLTLLTSASGVFAQAKVPVMGYVANYNATPDRLAILKKGLEELGYREGQNIKIEYRTARLDREYFDVTAELLALKVDLILAANAPATVAAAKSTQITPIVMAAVNDPVGLGAVKSLEKPGTNVTGTTIYVPQLIGERLKILKRINPNLDKASMILNGNNPNNAAQFELMKREAAMLGIQVQSLDIRKSEDVALAFDQARAFGSKAFLNAVDSFINSQRFELAKQSLRHKLPFFYTDKEYVLAGGLMSLGPGHQEGYYNAAKYVDKILKGTKPAELPIAGPTQFTLSVSKSALDKFNVVLTEEVRARVNEWLP